MISDARKSSFDSMHPVFFDANVWLSLYAPPSDEEEHWKAEYTKVLNRVVSNNVPVILDSIVIGEYINRFCRIEFSAYAGPNSKQTFKQFRDNEPDIYQPIAQSVVANVKEILELPLVKRVNGVFASMDLVSMLDEFALGKKDWNDQQIVDMCKRNACSLITNDADFKDADIQILTCNSRLLGYVK